MKKIIAFLCALVMLLLCFASCNQKGDPSEQIRTSELSEYTIVYSKNCSASVARKANVLAVRLDELYGITVKTGNDEDCAVSEKEILIGYTNRAESREFLSDIRSKDYGYAMVGGKLCIAGGVDEFTTKAVDAFMSAELEKISKTLKLGTPVVTRSTYDIDDLKINGESIKGWSVMYPSENQNSEKEIAEQIRDKIVEISDFVPFLCTEKENITDKVISVSVADSDAKILVSGNKIDLCGRDAEALTQVSKTVVNKLSNAPVENKVINVEINNNEKLEQFLTVMSFNIRYNLEEGGTPRMAAAVAQIKDLSPDVIGIQEDSKDWYQYFDTQLTEYTGLRNALAAGNNEYLSIYYKKSVFSPVDKTDKNITGLLWLSDTPTVPSKYSESLNNRGMQYAVLTRKSDGAKFCIVNTHLENDTKTGDGPTARQKQIKVLLRQTAKIVSKNGDIPSILVGDFNATKKKDGAVHTMISDGGYVDCSVEAFRTMTQGTWNESYEDFYTYGIDNPINKNSETIDFCYASEDDFLIFSYKVSAKKYNDLYTSDHFPIVVKLMFNK